MRAVSNTQNKRNPRRVAPDCTVVWADVSIRPGRVESYRKLSAARIWGATLEPR